MKNIPYIFLIIILIQVSCKKSEDLSSFVKMNDKIESSNDIRAIKNETLLGIIYMNAEKNEELLPQKEMAERAHEISNNFTKYLSDLKKVIKEKHTTEFVDELFFNGEDISDEGVEFLNYIENYKTSLVSTVVASHPDIVGMINSNFDIGSIKDRRGQQTNWLTLNYRGFPPTSSIIKISEMQADIKGIETTFYSSLLDVKLKEINELDNIKNKDVTLAKVEKEGDTIVKEEDEKEEFKVKLKKEEPKVELKKEEPKKIKKPETTKKETIKEDDSKSLDENTHRVGKGETIYSIANMYDLTTVRLKKLNGMTNNNLVIGQKIRIKK